MKASGKYNNGLCQPQLQEGNVTPPLWAFL
jgi:hypothetical protein